MSLQVQFIHVILVVFLAKLIHGCTEVAVTIKAPEDESSTQPTKVGIVYPTSRITISCSESQQLQLNGIALYTSSAIYTHLNFTPGDSFACSCTTNPRPTSITLIDPPKFPSENKIWTAKAGDTVRIPCLHSNRYPGVTYTTQWFKSNGVLVSNNNRVMLEGQDLLIPSVSPAEASTKYQCNVYLSGHGDPFTSPLYSIALLSRVEPTLTVNGAVAMCTSQQDGYHHDRVHCITTTHNSGYVHSHCSRGTRVLAPIMGVSYVECKVEQRANGSSSVISSRTSKRLSSENDPSRGGLIVKGRLDKSLINNTLSVEVSFHFTPPTHSPHLHGGQGQLYVGTIKWDHSSPQPIVQYEMRQEQLLPRN